MEQNQKLVSDVMTALRVLEPDVVRRNDYMNTRDRYVYGTGLFDDLDIEGWFAEHNYLRRVVDIHTAQLMGRPYNVYSYYNKEDLSPYADQEDELKLAEMRNQKAKANADMRKRAVDAIIRDNGGYAIWKDGARIGSVYGMTAFKQWFDKDEKKVRQSLIESPQSLFVGWTDNNFRDFDFCAYVYQISQDQAYRKYGDKLADGDIFATSREGDPLSSVGNSNTSDPLQQLTNANGKNAESDIPMVTVIDLSGYLKEWGSNGSSDVKPVKRGKEDRVSIIIVGGHLVQVETREKFIPKYYIIQNRVAPRRANGESDLSQSALDINKEIVQLEADSMMWANKNLFKLIQAKGFTAESIPKKKPRKMQVVAMAPEQSLEEMTGNNGTLQEFRALIESKIEAFVRVTNVGRVLFDDPSINSGSNQALITTLKPVIDIVEDKQSRWEPVIREMFEDALALSAEFIPELKDAVEGDDWYLCVEWPSVLRREDAAYQQMWLNRFINNTVSLETYLEKMGDNDTSEEVDRLKDELKDPVTAAILGRQVSEIAHQAINKSLGIPPWGYVIPKVNFRGDLSPQEVGNIAHNYSWDQGPYGPAIGPQGNQGTAANDNFVNQGFLNGNPYDGGTGAYQGPSQGGQQQAAPAPTLTPDQNQPGMQSTAGSGMAQPTSPGGAINKSNQNQGR